MTEKIYPPNQATIYPFPYAICCTADCRGLNGILGNSEIPFLRIIESSDMDSMNELRHGGWGMG